MIYNPLLHNVLIDSQDSYLLTKKWYIIKARCYKEKYYLASIKPTTYLHRVIMDAKKGETIDHINGNTFDNRRCNLRKVTASVNRYNSAPRSVKGVNRELPKGVFKHGRKYQVHIGINKKCIYLGAFNSIEEASKVYEDKLKEILARHEEIV